MALKFPIFMDAQSTTPVDPRVVEAMIPYFTEKFGHPASRNHPFGWEAEGAVDRAREAMAKLIGARDPKEIVFTSGGTESINLALKGVAEMYREKGNHIVTTVIEQRAGLDVCKRLERQGFTVTYVPVQPDGLVDAEEIRKAITDKTILVSIMAANNETGALQPIEELAEVCRAAGIPMHVDAVQAAGRLPLDVRRLGADMVSISAHKMGGPVGIGGLWVKGSRSVKPLLLGGGQEARRRPGTEPVALAAGFAAAVRSARERLADSSIQRLRDRMERELAGAIPGLVVNAAGATRLSNTSSLTLPGVDAEAMVIRMDLAGFAISTGSACSTGAARPSHVLAAMGLNRDQSASTIRVSLGRSTTSDDIETFVPALSAAAAALRGAGVGGKA